MFSNGWQFQSHSLLISFPVVSAVNYTESQLSLSEVISLCFVYVLHAPSLLSQFLKSLLSFPCTILCNHKLTESLNALEGVGHVCFYFLFLLDLWLLEECEWEDSRSGSHHSFSSKRLVLDQGLLNSSKTINWLNVIHLSTPVYVWGRRERQTDIHPVPYGAGAYSIPWMRKGPAVIWQVFLKFDLPTFYYETSTSPGSQSDDRGHSFST